MARETKSGRRVGRFIDQPRQAKPVGRASHCVATDAGRRLQGAWLLVVSLTWLALLVGGPRLAEADADSPPTLDTPAWHTVYLPFVAHQKPPPPPLYQLTIASADLDWLYDDDNLWSYETVPAVFTYEDVSYEVQVRFRGGTTRYLPKKSWKVKFPAATPFQGQRELNLNAEYPDKSLLREALAYDLFERAGLLASRTQYVRLEINGEYMGLFLQVAQVDQRFLDRAGWDPNGNLYKGDYGSNFDWGGDYTQSYVKKTNREDSHDDVVDLLWLVNFTSEADLPVALSAVMDVGRYLDWYAVQTVLGNFEWVEKNYYLYHHLQQGWWALLPWDLDLTLGHNWGENGILDHDISWDNPIDAGTAWSPKMDGQWNKLITRVLGNDDFKFAYCRRLRELMDDQFAAPTMFRRIDTFYVSIIPYAEADPYKWGSNQEFHDGPDELKTYVTNRLAWLAGRIPGYCPASGPMPLINELLSDNVTTLADEAGEYEPWIELYNPGLVSFDAGGMRLQAVLTGTPSAQWALPAGTVIPPGGFLLIWADGEPGEGPLHANFRLDRAGGAVTLFDAAVHGGHRVDERGYGPLGPDLSFGRVHDGDDNWITFHPATPGWSNLGRAPLITSTLRTPLEPAAGQAVTVTAWVTDENLAAVSLHWAAAGLSQVVPMYEGGSEHHYHAAISPLGNGTVVTYYVRAEDTAGLVMTDPPRPQVVWRGVPLASYSYVVGFQRPPLYLNELLAINQDTLDDELGESDDWFEIYNVGSVSVDLGGMYLTDAIENTTKWQIPPGVSAPPGGYVLLWADNQTGQGPTHVNFKLNGDGERLALYAGPASYNGLIDEVYYGPQTVDRPWGRYPDGEASWRYLVPTPGQANRQPPPVISDLGHAPPWPLAGQPVTVAATIHDDGTIATATLYYSVSLSAGSAERWLSFQPLPMQHVSDHRYSAPIPPQAEGVSVAYYVLARDDWGDVTTYPAGAPDVTYGYQVGYVPPSLFINEFLASNDTVNQDEMGEYEDWVELYNAGGDTIDVGGMYLTDDLGRPTKWRLPDGTTIPPGGFLLIWTDDDEGDGPLHASFKLSRGGEEIGLFDRDSAANALLDSVVFGPQRTDVSSGRQPDGTATWTTFESPTPGESNTFLPR